MAKRVRAPLPHGTCSSGGSCGARREHAANSNSRGSLRRVVTVCKPNLEPSRARREVC